MTPAIPPAAFPAADLEWFLVEAVANVWVVTLGFNGRNHNQFSGQRFVFSTPHDMAKWLVETLPTHERGGLA